MEQTESSMFCDSTRPAGSFFCFTSYSRSVQVHRGPPTRAVQLDPVRMPRYTMPRRGSVYSTAATADHQRRRSRASARGWRSDMCSAECCDVGGRSVVCGRCYLIQLDATGRCETRAASRMSVSFVPCPWDRMLHAVNRLNALPPDYAIHR